MVAIIHGNTNVLSFLKDHLVESMKSKINDLKNQQEELADEIKANEELGEKITKVVESYTTSSEFSKYQLFTGELNKIIGLLLSLTQRMHRYELMLQDLDMSEESDRIQRVCHSSFLRILPKQICHLVKIGQLSIELPSPNRSFPRAKC